MLSFASGSAINRITAGVKTCHWISPARITPVTGLHPPGVFIVQEKENCLSALAAPSSPSLLQGTLDLLILHALQRGPMHGYAIAQTIHLLSDEVLKVEEGSLYPSLSARVGWSALCEVGLLGE